jgi:hypothetical protein
MLRDPLRTRLFEGFAGEVHPFGPVELGRCFRAEHRRFERRFDEFPRPHLHEPRVRLQKRRLRGLQFDRRGQARLPVRGQQFVEGRQIHSGDASCSGEVLRTEFFNRMEMSQPSGMCLAQQSRNTRTAGIGEDDWESPPDGTPARNGILREIRHFRGQLRRGGS